jgi:2-dehydropantoate 2-reductase
LRNVVTANIIHSMSNTNIFIIGAGAIGKALGVFLKAKGKDVILVRASTDEAAHLEDISITLNDNTSIRSHMTVTGISDVKRFDGIVVLTNKSFANQIIAERIKSLVAESPVVVMQNGLDVEQPFIENGFSSIYRCVLFATSQIISSKEVRFKPVSVSPIGVIKGDSSKLAEVVSALDNLHLRFSAVDDIRPLIWKKTIANCIFNSICPLLEVDNGLFSRDEVAMSIANRVIKECVAVANQVGITLDAHSVAETVKLISKSSEGQLISTLQDIKEGRQTEIDSLNFAIARIATAVGKENLIVETKLLGELTKLKAELCR